MSRSKVAGALRCILRAGCTAPAGRLSLLVATWSVERSPLVAAASAARAETLATGHGRQVAAPDSPTQTSPLRPSTVVLRGLSLRPLTVAGASRGRPGRLVAHVPPLGEAFFSPPVGGAAAGTEPPTLGTETR